MDKNTPFDINTHLEESSLFWRQFDNHGLLASACRPKGQAKTINSIKLILDKN